MSKRQKRFSQERETDGIIDSAVGELRFANLQIEALYNALDEVGAMTDDPLARKVVEMAKERHNIDKLIHARILFS